MPREQVEADAAGVCTAAGFVVDYAVCATGPERAGRRRRARAWP